MITTITDTETRLTNTLRMTTEALTLVTAERDALRADAERWRKYKARKDAVLSAGMARNPLRQKPPCGECHLSLGEICDICGASTEGTP